MENKERTRAAQNALNYRKRNPEKTKAIFRAGELRRNFGITVEQYDAMVASQNNLCACCGKDSPNRRLAVDHCHTTGKVRALLCHSCNNHLGIYERRKSDFETYLEKYSG